MLPQESQESGEVHLQTKIVPKGSCKILLHIFPGSSDSICSIGECWHILTIAWSWSEQWRIQRGTFYCMVEQGSTRWRVSDLAWWSAWWRFGGDSLAGQIWTKADRPPYSALNGHLPQLLISDFPPGFSHQIRFHENLWGHALTGFCRTIVSNRFNISGETPLKFNERTTLVTLLQGFGIFCHRIGGFAPKCILARKI